MSLPPDLHVHSEWSWDATRGSMERSCERAVELGLPGIAFTEHADWVAIHDGQRPMDVAGYLDAVERCRQRFKGLRILSGVEFGEPHWFPEESAAILAGGKLDRVLGSVHCVRIGSEIIDASEFRFRPASEAMNAIKEYFREMLDLVDSPQHFDALAHLDYPKRYWPSDLPLYREEDFEEELRAILTAAQKRGLVLEANTTRGDGGEQRFCPGRKVLRWWHEMGGEAVSFGSDAHHPEAVAGGFKLAVEIVEAAGFKPAKDPLALWRR
ncbi:MAG: histidinol-phosphatase HisJ family protein [Chloroflexi bacterium]|nr:MAG: histidinol-phosphatase HisJ family protein [Chloroflexota bacterium]